MPRLGGTGLKSTETGHLLSAPIQLEVSRRLVRGRASGRWDGIRACLSHPVEANRRDLAVERVESAGQSGQVPHIDGTTDLMPQIGGTCLTCDGNGQSGTS